jgi:hypothetical protein
VDAGFAQSGGHRMRFHHHNATQGSLDNWCCIMTGAGSPGRPFNSYRRPDRTVLSEMLEFPFTRYCVISSYAGTVRKSGNGEQAFSCSPPSCPERRGARSSSAHRGNHSMTAPARDLHRQMGPKRRDHCLVFFQSIGNVGLRGPFFLCPEVRAQRKSPKWTLPTFRHPDGVIRGFTTSPGCMSAASQLPVQLISPTPLTCWPNEELNS